MLRGPHPMGSYEVWISAEQLGRGVGWMMQHHGTHSVLLHPLTRYELKDHTERAMWLGPPLTLNLSVLSSDLELISADAFAQSQIPTADRTVSTAAAATTSSAAPPNGHAPAQGPAGSLSPEASSSNTPARIVADTVANIVSHS